MGIVVEFVAGPRCGEVDELDQPSPTPPLALEMPVCEVARGAGPVYRRREQAPDPRSGRWLFDHVPPADCGAISE